PPTCSNTVPTSMRSRRSWAMQDLPPRRCTHTTPLKNSGKYTPRPIHVVGLRCSHEPTKKNRINMNVNVQSIHFDADTKLVVFIKEKLGKLTQFHDSIISADVFLRVEHDGENRENKFVDIRLAVPGREHF